MKAIICPKYGPPEVLVLAEVPTPHPQKHQVLVKVYAASVNSGDVRIRGLDVDNLPAAPLLKFILRCIVGFAGPRKKVMGMVLAGEVVEVGESVTKFKVGDRVFAMTGMQFGAYAQYAAVSEERTISRMPTSASFSEAAALPFGGTTALYFLRKAKIARAKRVLVYGSSGAVGTAAVQIAASNGAEVVAVCGEDGIELAKELGATTVYNYQTEPLKTIAGQFDIIFDAVGKTTKADVAHLLQPEGVYITVGGLDTAKDTAADLEQLAKLFNEGKLKAVIDRVYALDEMVEAQRYVETGRKKGNVIVTVEHP